jgi:hypothetical protein
MKETFDYVVRKFTRVRKPPLMLITFGGLLLLYDGIWAGFPLSKLVWSSGGHSLELSADAPSELFSLARIVIATLLIAIGGIWSYCEQQKEHPQAARQVAIVIESRGLRDDDGRSLKEAVSAEVKGRVEELLVDLRRFNRDGRVEDPEGAANEIMQAHQDLRRRRALKDRRDVSLVYGGLTSVPFTFFMGVLMDDQGAVSTWDWDRTKEAWRKVSGQDDGRRFKVTWEPPMERRAEVVVAVSTSYPILDENLARPFPSIPVMRLDLEGRGQDSLVFRLGTRFERRNVPNAVIYQFERNADPPFTWGVQLPAPGERKVSIQRNTGQLADQ